jgi:hypothetical protein
MVFSTIGRVRWPMPAIGRVPGRAVLGIWCGVLFVEMLAIVGTELFGVELIVYITKFFRGVDADAGNGTYWIPHLLWL